MTALIALLGVGVTAAILLIISGARRTAVASGTPDRVPRFTDRRGRLTRTVAFAFVAGVPTRWPVAALACGLLGWFSSDLVGGRSRRDAAVARTEAIASWTEMLRDTMAAAHGLEAAITATAPVAPDAIRNDIASLAVAIEHEPLPAALHDLADRLAHPIGDLVVSALIVAANGSVRELADLLSTLAEAARDEAAMQLRVEAARARIRTAVRVITGCTLVTATAIVALNPRYVEVYSRPVGQLALVLIATCWGVALWWLAHMSEFRAPERFLINDATNVVVR